ncbi:MAG: ferredoxin [Candidatus Brocadiales bacterium]
MGRMLRAMAQEFDVFPLTFEPEMTWGRCYEREWVTMKVKKVWFAGDCVLCAMCVEEAPEAFDFSEDTGPQVKDGADLASCSEGIKQAAIVCPAQRIKYDLSNQSATDA